MKIQLFPSRNRCAQGALIGVLLACPVMAHAQDLITDRPDFTESAVVVPRGSVQVEAGFTWLDEGDTVDEVTTVPELLIRWGLTDSLELRIGLPNSIDPGDAPSGLGDGSIGVKWQLGPTDSGLDYALIATVSVPVGDDEFTSDEFDPDLLFTVGRDLGEKWNFGTQVGAGLESAGDEDLVFIAGTLVFGRGLGERGGTFFELAAEDVELSPASFVAHHGYTLLVGPDFQFDVHFGVGLTDDSPDALVGAGVSWRW